MGETALLPERIFLTQRPEVTIARPALSLVVYLDDPRSWAREHAARIATRLVDLVGPDRFRWFMTSRLDRWRTIPPDGLPALLHDLSIRTSADYVRHLFLFRIASETGAPDFDLTYREVDDRRSRRLGFMRIGLPHDHPPDDLLALTIEIAMTTPLWSGIAGYSVSTNPLYPREAYEWVLAWARRCLGLHVCEPDDFARAARTGLPGVAWLNLLGPRAIDALAADRAALSSSALTSRVSALPLASALLLRAGARPELGDANTLSYPHAIAEAAGILGRYLTPAPPPFPEPFGARSKDWMFRFAFPEQWA